MEELKLVEFTKAYEDLVKQCQDELQLVQQKTGVQFDLSELQESVDSDSMINIVFVGQYSAGKSSIIKMLTKNEGIEVGAAITTQQYTPYVWNGMYIVDTPGIQTGIREDHDAITAEAIQKSDLIVFVITNELFNPTILRYFNKLAYDMGKGKQMILAINKMSRGGEKKVLLADLQKVLAQPYNGNTMLSEDNFRPCFLDAQSYLDSLNISDAEIQEELYKISGYDGFVKTLNDFAEEKGLYGKLCSQIQRLQDCLNDIEAQLDCAEASGDQEAINELVYIMKGFKRDKMRELDNLYISAKQDIRNAGGQLASNLSLEVDKDDFIAQGDTVNEKIESELKQIAQQREDIIEEINTELNKYGKNLAMQQNELIVSENRAELSNVEDWKLKLSPDFVENGTQTLLNAVSSEAFASGLTSFASKFIFNGFWDKLPIIGQGSAKAAAFAGKAIPVIGSIVQFGGALLSKSAEDNANTRLRQAKSEIRKTYGDWGNAVYEAGRNDINQIADSLDKYIAEGENILFAGKNQSQAAEEAKKDIELLQDKCNDLLQTLDGMQ
ncbi:GTPase domain-containing protein [Megasphaera elsdenii]|uniref:GTPase domain-containing protein n=1 Tax=Megasphaera elsdenii TaxID=907 RepID=UPI003CFD03EB